MTSEYLVFVAILVPSLMSVVLAFRKDLPIWLRVTGGVVGVVGACLSGVAGILLSNEGADLITGGDSFCYVVNMREVSNPPFPVMVIKRGEHPLYDVTFRVMILNKQGMFSEIGTIQSLGNFPIGNGREIIPFSLPANGDYASFNVFFVARNGPWVEVLRLRLVNGTWKRAIQVFRYLPDWQKRQ